MAYDPNSAYQPPRRPYYGQTQQRAPVQNGYGDGYQEQYGSQGRQPAYDQPQQRALVKNGYGDGYPEQYGSQHQPMYDQGYPQSHDQGYQPSYEQFEQDMRSPSQYESPQYYHGHQEGYRDHRQPVPTQDPRKQPQERHYDPRYQQRQEKGRPRDNEPQQRQPRIQQPPRDQQYQVQEKPNPKNARMYAQQSPAQQQPAGHQYAGQGANQRGKISSETRPQTAPQPQKPQAPPKMSMEEWKAKEREKMHAEAMSPDTLPFDNAFPVFPTKQNKPRPGTANGDESARSSTLTSKQEERPSMSRNDSHSNKSVASESQQQQYNGRPSAEHKPYSFEPIQDRAGPNQPIALAHQRPRFERQPSNQAASPVNEHVPQQWPAQTQRHSPPNPQAGMQQRNFCPNSSAQDYTHEAQQSHRDPRQSPQQSRQQAQGRSMQALNTRAAQQPPNPSFLDHQPLSPAAVPQRPSTSHDSRSARGQPMTSSAPAYSRPNPNDFYAGRAPPTPRTQAPPAHAKHESLNDIYDDYSNHHVAPPAPAPPQSRDDQIEAEMPDFDSAAPGGTSLLHKRSNINQRGRNGGPDTTRPTMQNMPSQQSNSSAQSLPAQAQRFMGQQPDPSTVSLPYQQAPKQKQGGITNGFVFGVPGEQQPYDDPYEQRPPMQHGTPYVPAVQPPFARETQPRRSMDDARQMPHRQAPPHPQRFPQNCPPPCGQYPAQHRLGMGQAANQDHLQQRGTSAPPPRQGLPSPSGRRPSNGAPLTQQRSAPDQSDQRHRNNSNPDALPYHPPPVRPGLMDGGLPQNLKSLPVRHGSNATAASHQRQVSIDRSSQHVTRAEIEQLRAAVSANPNNSKQAMLLANKLVEASTVLATEGGRADPKNATNSRVAYINEAHKIVKRQVAAGSPDAQFYLADCYGSGTLGLEVDAREAFKLYQAAAKAGHPEAAYRTAMCCEMGSEEGGGTNRDYAKAVQWYRRAAALGDPAGMFKVGVISLKGLLGQPRNIGEAVIWLKRALQSSEQDNPHAQAELAQLYESANTNPEVRNKVVADDKYALQLFQEAAGLGHKSSQFRLGQAYEYGSFGLAIDQRASISWYSKAAAQGEHQAELALSGWYLTGADGILEHSDMEAYLWARKAASSEPPLAKAMFAMGYFTETGIGCPASIDEAKKWYARAASHRFPKAQERLEELRRNPGKGRQPANGKLTRKDQKRDESECVLM
ncbi:hypothetical protein LTR37_002980 [Vermiconidia calcicola]|uniref:Uncharacterized protein n=1 Tax=Vermiconidia calcicola TaxID=1690605 RepID=A0ACC3NUB8_9PEZI|nr:hypothetical protein LTR37_002980 [Vermiconidia calcicola]